MASELAALLRREKKELLAEWGNRVRHAPDVPIARQLSIPALFDNMPDLIDDLIGCLDSSDPCAVAERVACGRELGRSRGAEAHAAHRSAEGYSVRQALLELSVFRMVLLEAVGHSGAVMPVEDMMIAHAALDEAMRTCAHEMQQVNVASSLGESNARKEILRVVTHDLRNPLSTVLLAAETLATSTDDAAVKKGAIIIRNTQRMRRLIDDLGDINAMETGSLSVAPKPERLSDLLRDAAASLRDRAEKKGVELAADTNLDVVVQADAHRVHQVLGNLIGNAIEVLTHGGHVSVSAEVHGEEAIVMVRDDGPGIDADHQSLVFDRFWRAPNARYAGSGLGLSISRGIIEALGGRIWVESAPGQGATFCFTLQVSPIIRTEPTAS
ncbi:MAG TPA: sensor histidine kinase [Kofleriaceae bacterium]|nr:sensor histidine kinase [Kofleriaceae bacterium]